MLAAAEQEPAALAAAVVVAQPVWFVGADVRVRTLAARVEPLP